MKTIINSIKTIALTATAIFALSFTTVSNATANANDNELAELKYMGTDANLPVFRLVVDNAAEYVITVREANGDVLFTEKLKSGTSVRTYKLDTENADQITGTTFEVANKTTNKTTVYKLKNFSRTVENEVIVAKS